MGLDVFPTTERKAAPYAAPANVMAILNRFREFDLPDEQFTPKFLEDLGIPHGNVHRTLRGFEFLGLLSEGGTPTEKWQRLRVMTDDEFPSALGSIVKEAYADVFKRVDPARDSSVMISNQFRKYSPARQRDRMVTLFLSLCRESGIETLDTPRKRETKAAISPQRGRPPVKLTPPTAAVIVEPRPSKFYGGGFPDGMYHPLITGLLSTLPPQGESWTKAGRMQWLAAAGAVLDLLYPRSDESS
jgi:hypothetical protein